jgi:hypothetical protein
LALFLEKTSLRAIVNELKKLKQQFLAELTICREKNTLNELLAMAMEALFRGIPECSLFLLLANQNKRELQGRYFLGEQSNIEAAECKISFDKKTSPLLLSLFSDDIISWKSSNKPLQLPINIATKLIINHALIKRVKIETRPVGSFLICRDVDIPFSSDDLDWLNKVIDQVNKGMQKKKEKN